MVREERKGRTHKQILSLNLDRTDESKEKSTLITWDARTHVINNISMENNLKIIIDQDKIWFTNSTRTTRFQQKTSEYDFILDFFHSRYYSCKMTLICFGRRCLAAPQALSTFTGPQVHKRTLLTNTLPLFLAGSPPALFILSLITMWSSANHPDHGNHTRSSLFPGLLTYSWI